MKRKDPENEKEDEASHEKSYEPHEPGSRTFL